MKRLLVVAVTVAALLAPAGASAGTHEFSCGGVTPGQLSRDCASPTWAPGQCAPGERLRVRLYAKWIGWGFPPPFDFVDTTLFVDSRRIVVHYPDGYQAVDDKPALKAVPEDDWTRVAIVKANAAHSTQKAAFQLGTFQALSPYPEYGEILGKIKDDCVPGPQ